MKIRIIKDVKLKDKRVILRTDFNVPIKNNRIIDTNRIDLVLPTIKYLINKGAKVIIISHLGRPNGKIIKKYSLFIVYKYLKNKLKNIKFVSDCFAPRVKKNVNAMKNGNVILLENLRFYSGEKDGKMSQGATSR